MTKAIIFDCFGVLATEGWLPFCQKHFGDNPKRMEIAQELNQQVDRGKLDYHEFVQKIAKMADVHESIVLSWIENNVPNEPLLNYIRDVLKPRFKVSMLSNAGANWLNDIFEPDQIALFDDILLSFEVGFIKPQPEIYQLAAKRLGVSPGDCVFIDDRERFYMAAQDCGMQAIVYKDFEQLKSELTNLLS